MTRADLGKRIYQAAHITGNFTLRSGQVSGEYFDKFLFQSKPDLLREIGKEMREMVPPDTEVLAGLELGAIPIVTALSLETGIEAAFVRKKAKAYGTCRLAEGAETHLKKVCVVEDIVTTGGQIIESVQELRNKGAVVETVLCVVLRNPDAVNILAEHGLRLKYLYTMDDING